MKLNIFKKFIFAGLSICAILCVSNVSAMKRSATWDPGCNYDEADFDNNTEIGDIFALESDEQNNNDGDDDVPLTLDVPSTPNNLSTATTTNNNNYSTGDESHNFVNNETSSNVPTPTQHDTQQDLDDSITEDELDDILDLVEASTVAQATAGPATSSAESSNSTQSTISQQPVQETQPHSPLYLVLKEQCELAKANKQCSQSKQKLLDLINEIKASKQLMSHEKNVLIKNTYRALGRIFEKTNQNAEVYPISKNDITQKLKEGCQERNYKEAKKIFLSILKITHKKQYKSNERLSALYHLGQITEILSNSSKLSKKAQLFFEILNQYKTTKNDLNGAEPNYFNDQEELLDILQRSKSLKCASNIRNQTYCDLGEIFAKLKSISQSSEFKPFAWLKEQIAAGINAMLKNNFLEAQNIFLDVLKYCNNNANENIKISAYYFLGRITEILSDSSTTNNNSTSSSTANSEQHLTQLLDDIFDKVGTPFDISSSSQPSTTTTAIAQPDTGQASSLATPSNTTDSCLSIDLIKQLNDAQLFFK